MINKIGTNQLLNTNLSNNQKRQSATNQTEDTQTAITRSKADVVEIGTKTVESVTYKKQNKKLSESDINAIKAEAERNNANLISLIQKLFLKQGKYSTLLKSDAESIELAKASLSEDGEFGINAVSENIVNFAIAVSGGDKSKLSEMKSAIDKGFEEAEKAFGGQLPDICYKTHDEIIKKLDTWAKEV